jgi:predicted transcriptional regulator
MSLSRSRYKKEAYEQAIKLRKRGFTYTEIAKICDVSRGTVSNWLATLDFSKQIAISNKKQAAKDNKVRISLVNKARNAERKSQYKEILRLAEIEFRHYRTSPLFVAGLVLYQSLGDQKQPRVIRLTDLKPENHLLFIKFLTEFLGVKKENIHFWLLLYPDLDEVLCMKHWSKRIHLSVAQFYKNQVVKSLSNKATLHFGVGNTIIGNVLLKKKLLLWVELMQKELIK